MATKPTTGRSKNSGAAADVLGALAALVPTKATPKATKSTKWEMELTPEARKDAERWINGKTVLEPVQKRVENAKNDFLDFALDVMVKKLFANKTKASNPLVVLKKDDEKTVDHQFQLTMTDKFKYRFPDVPEGVDPHEHFVEVFVGVGLHPKDAESLVENELDFNPITGFRTLTELLEGRYGEGREWIDSSAEDKLAGGKFAALLMWDGTGDPPDALTPEEKLLVIERSLGMTVKQGFYDRVATYCQNVSQLHGVFKIIQPIIYPASPKFAVNDTATDKTRRMISAAADILGTVTVDSED
jgi:hypothetical protein